MNTITEPIEQPGYLVDHRGNLIIHAGSVKLTLSPADALDLIKFIERTGYQAHANGIHKRSPQ